MGRSFNSATVCGTAVQVNVVFELPDFRGSGGKNQVLSADGVDHVDRRQSFGLQSVGVEINLHLPLLAAIGIRNGGARNRHQPGADKVHAVIEELLLGKLLA